MHMRMVPVVVFGLAFVPAMAGAQDMHRSRLGLAPIVSARIDPGPNVTAVHRRAGWEVGAVVGGVAGAVVGRFIVVMYNDGRAEKMGTGREVLTMVGAAAVGAGIGALIQKIVS